MQRLAILGLMAVVGSGCTEANPFLDGETETETAGTSTVGTTSASSGPTSTSPTTTGETDTTTTNTTTTGPTSTSDPVTTASETTESTTSPTDTDDESTSTGPAVCPDTHTCVPSTVPAGWGGPITYAEADPKMMPACPDSYPAVVPGLQPRSNLDTPVPTCGCDCGSATGVSCSTPVLDHWDSTSSCPGTRDDRFNMASSGNCTTFGTSFAGGESWLMEEPAVIAGSCSPQPTEMIPEASFANNVLLCESAVAIPGCGDGSDCVGLPPTETGFADRLCIYRGGEQTCPAGSPYDTRVIFHEAFADNRDCSSCTCGAAQGSCAGTYTLFNSSTCSAGQGGGTLSAGVCDQSVSGVGVFAGRWNEGAATASCQPSVSAPEGEATPSDPVTLCCLGR